MMEKKLVKQLGEKIGYRNMMYLISELWKEDIKEKEYPTNEVLIPTLKNDMHKSCAYKEYHKIKTVFSRDPKTNYKTLLEGTWAKPEFEILKDIDWICTEKIDGTNIRIMWDGRNVQFGGKTNKAQIPEILIEVLQDTFTNKKMKEVFPNVDNICLYGEGYGKKIQKGENYLSDRANFILFDVKVGKWWLTRKANEDIATKLNINIVPIIGIWKLEYAIDYVKNGFKSTIAQNKDYVAEGLIMKPKIELFNRKGERIITKIKHRDFSK